MKTTTQVALTFISGKMIGLPVIKARSYLEAMGMTLRVIQEDGQHFAGTCEMRDNRINVAVEKGIVTEILDIG